MSRAGYVRIELRCNLRSGRIQAADVALHRPAVAQLLLGRTPDEAVELAGALHAVCGAAHRLAARRAVQAARGGNDGLRDHATAPSRRDVSAFGWRELEREALAEVALDHLCRLYIDWPEAIGLPVQPAQARAWRLRLNEPDCALSDLQIDAVLRHARELLALVPPIAGIRQRMLRRVRKTAACLTAIKLEPDRPGKIHRLVTPAKDAHRAGRSNGDDTWEGRTFTARGELIHRVSLARDALGREAVTAWAIDAPTDRLFACDGPVSRALMQLSFGGRTQLQRLARLAVLSFDPCVESRIEVREVEVDDARDVAGAGNAEHR